MLDLPVTVHGCKPASRLHSVQCTVHLLPAVQLAHPLYTFQSNLWGLCFVQSESKNKLVVDL